jgi:hypothetical protein
VFDYDPETKGQSAELHTKFSSSEESTRGQIHGENYNFFFFDSRGSVHKAFVPPGQTVNHAFYKGVLE